MSASDLAALILAAVAIVAVAALAVVCARLVQLVRDLERATAEFTATAEPAAAQLAEAAGDAGRQVDRLDDLIRTTDHLTSTVDTATQATLKALSNPVIRGAAIASGTSRAAWRLRGTGGHGSQRRGA